MGAAGACLPQGIAGNAVTDSGILDDFQKQCLPFSVASPDSMHASIFQSVTDPSVPEMSSSSPGLQQPHQLQVRWEWLVFNSKTEGQLAG